MKSKEKRLEDNDCIVVKYENRGLNTRHAILIFGLGITIGACLLVSGLSPVGNYLMKDYRMDLQPDWCNDFQSAESICLSMDACRFIALSDVRSSVPDVTGRCFVSSLLCKERVWEVCHK